MTNDQGHKDLIYLKMVGFIIIMGDLFPNIPKWNMWITDLRAFAERTYGRIQKEIHATYQPSSKKQFGSHSGQQ